VPPWLAKLLSSLREPVSIRESAPPDAKRRLEVQDQADEEARQKKEQRVAATSTAQAIRDLILRGLGAIVAVLGLGGSVAVVGGAILWIRFREAQLPANQALQVVPDDQLIVAGAVALVGFSIAALAGIVLIFALDPRGQVTRGSTGGVGLLLVIGVLYAWLGAELPLLEVVLVGLLGLTLAAACLGVAERTDVSFLPFAAAVFVSVMVFASVLNLRIAHDRAEVQPAAVLRGPNDEGLTGIYVTDTPEHIYIGRWQRRGEKRALFRIDRDEQTQLAIGAAIPQGQEARDQAHGLLERLKLDARKLVGGTPTLKRSRRPRREAIGERSRLLSTRHREGPR
jgi:hypothetical protein